MPIYDYSCREHGSFEVIHPVPERRGPKRCPRCGALSRPLVSEGVQIATFKPYVEYNLGHEPVRVTSAKQLEREAEARGLRVHGTIPGKKSYRQIDGGPKDLFPKYETTYKKVYSTGK